MAKKDGLSARRIGTIINTTSKGQEKQLIEALEEVVKKLQEKFPGIQMIHERKWLLSAIVGHLAHHFSDVDFHFFRDTSSMKPDGGILHIVSKEGVRYPILIAEKKNQGTNDKRLSEGKKKQALGNAIERLGKNVIGFRAALLTENIFPFVCFGDGCDFAEDSSILDRVVTIAMFGHLNKEYLHSSGQNGMFNRGSFYFKESQWTAGEMTERSYSIAEKSVYYYFSKYGESVFL